MVFFGDPRISFRHSDWTESFVWKISGVLTRQIIIVVGVPERKPKYTPLLFFEKDINRWSFTIQQLYPEGFLKLAQGWHCAYGQFCVFELSLWSFFSRMGF